MPEPSLPLILVDGSSYLFRAYHAPPHLTNSKGEATGAIYGVVNMLKSLMKQYQPEQMVVIFDAKGKTFRHHLYDEYKAHRPPMPDDLRQQIEPLHQIIQAMGLPLISVPEVEADDVIGTIAVQAAEKGQSVVISTGDKDLAQLVNHHISLINTMNNTVLDVAGVIQKFELEPNQIIDFLALMGDSADNIPGLPGVGQKTAVQLLQQMSSIDHIYEHLDDVTTLKIRGAKSLKQKFIDHQQLLRLSQELTTIKLDVDLSEYTNNFFIQPANQEQLITLFTQCEFRRWLSDLLAQQEDRTTSSDDTSTQTIHRDYVTITTEQEFSIWLAALKQSDYFCFDTETTSLNYMAAKIVGLSIAIPSEQPGRAAYIPLGHDYIGAEPQLGIDYVLNELKPLFEAAHPKKIGQNLKYDAHILSHYDIQLAGILNDTMLNSYVLNSAARGHGMDNLALQYLGRKTIHFEDIAGKGSKQLTFNEVAIDKAATYAAEDADITLQLHQVLYPKIQEEPTLLKVLEQLELPLIPVLLKMEGKGVFIDSQQLITQSQEIAIRLSELEQQAFDVAGKQFNLSSPKQLQQILFTEMALPVIKKTPKGVPSTAEEVLVELAEQGYELPRLIIEHRGLAKLKSTYTDRLPEMVQAKTQRVHTSYHQAGTITGRLSSTDPNLQNIPIKNAEGRRIRKAFIASTHHKILAADYSQIELRIMAHLSQDNALITAFAEGQDIHKATAAEVFSTPLFDVTTEQRRSAKAVNFGLIYGMSAFGLAKQLAISRAQAQHYIDTYFQRFPGVLAYMEQAKQKAHDQGYVETLQGRRLHLPEINAKNVGRRKAAERAAINAPMQGTAADIIKQAMINIHQWLLQPEACNIHLLMQVHDELVFEIPEQEITAASAKIKALMEEATKLKVPLIVDIGIGDNWEQAH